MAWHRKHLRHYVLFLALFGFLATVEWSAAAGYSAISKEELRSKLDDPKITIIDVRPSLSWMMSFSKVKGAVRKNPNEAESWLNTYPKETTIVLYCQGQATSSSVASKMASAGFQKVYVLQGGWSEWSKAGFPVEKK